MSEERFTRIDDRLDRVEIRLDRVEVRLEDLKVGQERLELRLEEVHRHAGVMHEDLVERIKALGGDDGTRLEMRRTVGEVRSQLAEHATLDDDAHRLFATSIKDHDRRLGSLEGRKKR